MLLKTSLESLEQTPLRVQKTFTALTEINERNKDHVSTILSTEINKESVKEINKHFLKMYEDDKQAESLLNDLLHFLDEQITVVKQECDEFKETVCKIAMPLHASRITCEFDLERDNEVEDGTSVYCYCKKESKGSMVACDNSDCPIEWFHYGCVGLTQPPTGKWLCRECKEKLG